MTTEIYCSMTTSRKHFLKTKIMIFITKVRKISTHQILKIAKSMNSYLLLETLQVVQE